MMIALSSDRLIPTTMSSFAETREDFVRALHALSAEIEPDGWKTGRIRLRRVRLTCRYAVWAKAFGELRTVVDHFGPRGCLALQAWQYQCRDGLLLCIGRRYRRGHKTVWITVKALYFL
jgi:hypothetical protein